MCIVQNSHIELVVDGPVLVLLLGSKAWFCDTKHTSRCMVLT